MSKNDNQDLIRASRTSYWNKDNATSYEQRKGLRLTGLIPYGLETMDSQVKRVLYNLKEKKSNLDKYVFLRVLSNTNTKLFYKTFMENVTQIAPLVYTPVVGEACQKYSLIQPFIKPAGGRDGLYISLKDLDSLDDIIMNYLDELPPPFKNPSIAVMTDGSRILGLGDLGMNGMGIAVGKLQLYSGAAGINPCKTLPICLDFGTNTQKYIDDPFYLGLKQNRPQDKDYYPAIEKVINSFRKNLPEMVLQFEDFQSDRAFGLLKRYKDKILCFNDDIQGTGAVILSGYINAIRISGLSLDKQKLVFQGAGSAAIGICEQITDYFMVYGNMTEEEAKSKFWLVDSKGLITVDRVYNLNEEKLRFARKDNNGKQLATLKEVIDEVNPTALFGLSSVKGAFTSQIIKEMARINRRPIIFPLSNPSDVSETTFQHAMEYTDNRVLFASGTAFEPYTDPRTNKIYYPSQGNNFYIFPGLGHGCILARPKSVNKEILIDASLGLAYSLNEEEKKREVLYPDITRIREISGLIASSVIKRCVQDNLTSNKTLIDAVKSSKDGALNYVKKYQWYPDYNEPYHPDVANNYS